MLLDEPTSELDPGGRRELIHLIKTIECTKIVVCHDLNLIVETCPRTLLLDEKRIIAEGDTEEVLADEELMLSHRLEVPSLLGR